MNDCNFVQFFSALPRPLHAGEGPTDAGTSGLYFDDAIAVHESRKTISVPCQLRDIDVPYSSYIPRPFLRTAEERRE